MIASRPRTSGSSLPESLTSARLECASSISRAIRPDRLEESIGPGGLEAGSLELPGHVLGGFAVAGAAGAAALESVIGQNEDVRPPALAVRLAGGAVDGAVCRLDRSEYRQQPPASGRSSALPDS